MDGVSGSLGTSASFFLRLGQTLFSSASLLFMSLGVEFYSYTAFWYVSSFVVSACFDRIRWLFTFVFVPNDQPRVTYLWSNQLGKIMNNLPWIPHELYIYWISVCQDIKLDFPYLKFHLIFRKNIQSVDSATGNYVCQGAWDCMFRTGIMLWKKLLLVAFQFYT